MSIRVGPDALRAVHEHVRRHYPEEACGVLVGRERDGHREISRAHPATNTSDEERRRRYVIEPQEFLAIERAARADDLDVLGFFHSHPDHPARPSAFDLEHAWPYYSYLIVSIERGRVAEASCWRLAEDRSAFHPEPLELDESKPEPAAD